MSDAAEHAAETDVQVDRRALVRRIATVAGLGAGAIAVPALASPAAAAPGDAIRAGSKNTAGDAQTSLRSTGTTPTLRLENARSVSGPVAGAVDVVSPQLQLSSPVASKSRPQLPDLSGFGPGAVGIAGGAVMVGADVGMGHIMPVQVHTSAVANLLLPIPAAIATILDTATLASDQRTGFPENAFDAGGRLAPGVRVPISLRGLVNSEKFNQHVIASVSLTAGGAQFSGAAYAHEDGELPGDITILSYGVIPAEVSGNGQPHALPATAGSSVVLDALDQLWISVTTATHLKVQVTAVAVPDPSVLVEPSEPNGALSPPARRGALQRQALRELMANLPNAK